LDHPDIHLLFEQVGGEAVPQGMHRDAFVDTRRQGSLMHGSVELTCAPRLDWVQAWKQPAALQHLALGSGHTPPGAQAVEHHRGEHPHAFAYETSC
jgi:hypothetical protein